MKCRRSGIRSNVTSDRISGNMKRLLLAGLRSGITWCRRRAWIEPIPNEQPVLAGLNPSLGSNGGLYIFPAMDPKGSMDDYSKKLATSPSGTLAYTPPGANAIGARPLGLILKKA